MNKNFNVSEHKVRMKFTVPLGEKKWWQFWKKKPISREEAVKRLKKEMGLL